MAIVVFPGGAVVRHTSGVRYEVDVRIGRDLRHAPWLLDGLAALEAAGEIRLRLHPRAPRWRDRVVVEDGAVRRVGRPYPWSVDLDVRDREADERRRVSVDLQDWREMWSHASLQASDVIVKRMCTRPEADVVERAYGVRVVPAGITGHGRADRWARRWPLRVAALAGRVETVVNEPRRLRRSADVVAAAAASEPLPPPVAPDEPYVFFQVAHHAWGEDLNRGRAAVIRALQERLGARFVGGMTFTGAPVPGYEDCASGFVPDHEAYLDLVRGAAVVVSTNGFGGSPPWKLAEYLEAGACIVSEPQDVELPVPLEDGRHLCVAATPDEVATAAARLLEDPQLRAHLSAGAAAYHAAVVAPEALARRVLTGEEASCPA
jgi:glycosyltransferase involved in cell wall biosynthesis